MMSIDESLWALVTGPHLHRHWSFHSAMSPRRASTKPGPGMVPLSSTRACAETTETTALSSLTNETSPCLLLAAPQHHHLQPFRTNTVQCSLGEGEFEQVQKVHKQLARDLYKILHQNTATGGRRGREIKRADTTPSKIPHAKRKKADRLWILLYFSFNSLLAVASLISLPAISLQVYLQV